MGSVKTETEGVKVLNTSREPKLSGPGQPGSVGDQALKDAVMAIAIGWALLFMLGFSLRKHNV